MSMKYKRGIFLATLALAVVTATPGTATLVVSDIPPLRAIVDPHYRFGAVLLTGSEVFVADDNKHAVHVYDRSASGHVAPKRVLEGLSTDLDFPSGLAFDPKRGHLWAMNNDTSDRAVAFPFDASGNTPPVRTIQWEDVNIGHVRGFGIAVDTRNDELWMSFEKEVGAVAVVDLETLTLRRYIHGPDAGMADPHGLAYDEVHGEVFVTNFGHLPDVKPVMPYIAVYDRLADGNTPPKRRIQGPFTQLHTPLQISIDYTRDEIYVADDIAGVLVFDRAASGNVAPKRRVSGPNTHLHMPVGVAVDAQTKEMWVGNWHHRMLSVFDLLANGDVAPVRAIHGSSDPVAGIGNPGVVVAIPERNEIMAPNCVSMPGIGFWPLNANGTVGVHRMIEGPLTRITRSLHGLAHKLHPVDPNLDEIFLPSVLEHAILTFRRTDSGNVRPRRVIQGLNTRIIDPQGIAYDPVNDELVVALDDARAILVFNRTDEGNVSPKRVITSPSFRKPVGIAVDPVNNEILVGDGGSSSRPATTAGVFVFPRLGNGDMEPIRKILGPNTRSHRVRQIWLDLQHDEIFVGNQASRSSDPPIYGGVAVFNRTDNGDVTPKRFLEGPLSNVRHPRGVTYDHVNDTIITGDSKLNEIRTFPRRFDLQQ